MSTELEIIAAAVILSLLLGLAKQIDQRETFIIIYSASIVLVIIGTVMRVKALDFPYQLLYIPFFESTLIKLSHLFFRYFFNEPYRVNLRGQGYPDQLKTNRNGFIRFINTLVSFFIIGAVMVSYILMRK